jgi:hypothetical protein
MLLTMVAIVLAIVLAISAAMFAPIPVRIGGVAGNAERADPQPCLWMRENAQSRPWPAAKARWIQVIANASR